MVGNPLADLLQPDLKVLVNLGYGPDDLGYSNPFYATNPASPVGLFPDVNPAMVLNELVTGAQQGYRDAVNDIMSGGSLSVSDPATASTLIDSAMSPASLSTSLTDITSRLQDVVQMAYNTLFPTADIVNALLTSVPAYDLELIGDNLTNPLDAVGLPIAADIGLITLAGGLEYEVLENAATQIRNDLSSLFS